MKAHKNRLTKLGLAGIMAVGALVLTACSGGPAGAGGESGGEQLDELRVAFVTHAPPGDTYWDIQRSGAESAAERNGIELLYSSDPEGAKQAQLVEQAIDQNVDGIVVSLSKPDALSGAIKKALDAGIPVFSEDAGMNDYEDLGILGHVGQDEFVAGQAVGTQLNEEDAKRIVCVIQEQGHVGLESRCEGVADTFEGDSELLYVQGTDMTNVSSTISSKLQTNSDIDFVVTLAAPIAMTALDSIQDAGSSAKLATFDVNDEVFQELQDGNIVFANDQQPWLMAYTAIEAVRHYHDGGFKLGGGQPVLTGPSIITQENLDAVSPQFDEDSDSE
ncbi:MAG: substrate-binding domain-containing protein [Canibacter sp.]